MTLFVHIGMQKTGTTYLQRALAGSRESLKSVGLAYPSATAGLGPDKGTAHHFIPHAIKGGNTRISPIDVDVSLLPNHIAAISRQVRETGDGLISSEAISKFLPAEIEQLRAHLSEFETKIVVYLRRQDAWLDSLFSQALKSGQDTALDEFVTSQSRLMDYAKLLASWAEAFGRDNIIVRTYERLDGRALWDDFAQAIERPGLMSIQPSLASANVRLPPNLTAVMKAMHIFGYKETLVLRKMLEDLSDSFPNEDGLHYLSADTASRIMKQYKESNRVVAEEYLGRSELFADCDPLPEAARTELNNELLIQVLGGLILKLINRVDYLEQHLRTLPGKMDPGTDGAAAP